MHLSRRLSEPGQARAVQIDIDARRIGTRYPTEVNLVGDAGPTLAALLPFLREQGDRSWRTDVEEGVARWWRVLEAQAKVAANPVNPQLVMHELGARLPDRCVLTADSGSATDWWARHVPVRAGMDAILSGTLASMAPAVPYALAAKLAFPDRPVATVIGDGAMQMLGNAALQDLAVYRHRFTDPRLVVCVLNNRDLNQVTWEQRTMDGEPKVDASQILPDFRYADYAKLLDLGGRRVERPEDIGPAFDDAFAADRPFVVEVVTDPEVPPLPPHIGPEMAKGLASAIRGGESAARDIIRQSVKAKWAELTTR